MADENVVESVENPDEKIEEATEEATEPRKLGELLQIVAKDGYSALTDEEIEMVIQHKAQRECNNAILEEMNATTQLALQLTIAQWEDNTQRVGEQYQALIDAAMARLDASYNLDFSEDVKEVEPIDE